MSDICSASHIQLLDNILRPLIHNPKKMFKHYVKPGMHVLDTGCGGGFASIGLAELVGTQGSVTSVDLQQEMLDFMMGRAEKKGISASIRPHKCDKDRLGVSGHYDFINASYMVHELPDTETFFKEVFTLMKKEARFFIAEPLFHVSAKKFDNMLKLAVKSGFTLLKTPRIRFSRAVVLAKN